MTQLDISHSANFDTTSPESLINMMPKFMVDAALSVPSELFELTEDELRKKAFPEGYPHVSQSTIRTQFWEEHDVAYRQGRPMDVKAIQKKVSSRIFSGLVANPFRLAWLLSPPTDYTDLLKDIHSMSLEQMRRACQVDPVGPDGKVNVKLIEAQKKIFEHVDFRIKGSFIQRIDQRNMNVNINADATSEVAAQANQISKMTMAELNQRIAYLEKKSMRLSVPGHVDVDLMKGVQKSAVDVTPTASGSEATPPEGEENEASPEDPNRS